MLRFFRLGFSRCASLYITDTIFKFFYVFIVASNYFCIFSRLNEVHKKVVWINKTRLNYILSARGYASHLEWTIWNENELGWLFSHNYNLRASNIFFNRQFVFQSCSPWNGWKKRVKSNFILLFSFIFGTSRIYTYLISHDVRRKELCLKRKYQSCHCYSISVKNRSSFLSIYEFRSELME